MEKVIGIIDLKSFYASCECAVRHLDIFKTPLVCCDPYRSESSIVMSVTPYLKERYGVSNVCRKRDLPTIPGMIYAVPRMSYYLQVSSYVVSIFLKYVSYEDLHVYSVDESFLNLGPYIKMYGSPERMIQLIQQEIFNRLGLIATAGIGPNMFLAKIALDNEGKKKKPFLAHWTYEDVPTKLWKIKPIDKIWSIAEGTKNHLARIGINSLEGLAKANSKLLEREFGVMGLQLKNLANGRDDSDIREKVVPLNPSLSNGQTLRKPLSPNECVLLLREMTDELAIRLRKENYLAGKIGVWANMENGSYSKEMTIPYPTDSTKELFQGIQHAFFEKIPYEKIYGLSISFGKLSKKQQVQLSLFEDVFQKEKEERFDDVMDKIRETYGRNAIFRCSALLENSTIRQRHMQIGGHRE
ncbi:MAG: hypothetical protein PUI68_04470 [Mollicutes bacterium]|nr:hypothetical protein [Mollicutes bacterium]